MLLAREHRTQLVLVQSWRGTWDTANAKTVVFKMHLVFKAILDNVFGPVRGGTPEKHKEAIFGTSTNQIFIGRIKLLLVQSSEYGGW